MTTNPQLHPLIGDAEHIVREAWADYARQAADARSIAALHEMSAHVSTNRVFQIHFTDTSTLVAKVSSYGSYFFVCRRPRPPSTLQFVASTR